MDEEPRVINLAKPKTPIKKQESVKVEKINQRYDDVSMHSKNSKKSKNTDKKSISNYDQPPMKKSQPFDNINFKKRGRPIYPYTKIK